MPRVLAVAIAVTTCLALAPAASAQEGPFEPGAPGIGDPYFPLDGNGGYDVRRYRLDVAYDPATDMLTGVARIRARATQGLSAFNLDLAGLDVRAVSVDGRSATWTRDGQELTVTPPRPLRAQRRFTTVVRYDGVPESVDDFGSTSGFLHTDDGALVVGEPHVAATWFPVNDHPLDKAAFTFRITVPAGLEAVANGVLLRTRAREGVTTWVWRADEPMAPYLATATVGEFDLRAYEAGGIRYWDAYDPDLFTPVAPRTGERAAYSQIGDGAHKRLARTIDVPAGGAQLSFWAARDTEPDWDYLFVEAHTAGADDWTTLPDLNGHTSQATGFSCPAWLALHPSLARYQTPDDDGTCSPAGTTGAWWAAAGHGTGYERWTVDLSAYAGRQVEVAISYAGDASAQHGGVVVDDVEVSTGVGSTSFEDDGDALDGWTVPGAPAGGPVNPNDWIAGTVADAPPTVGELAEEALARQPEIIGFLAGIFGPYPFSAAGGLVDDLDGLGFALENQTRPIYAEDFFVDRSGPNDGVVVHELAHQWYGDSVALAGWRHIWLNEGFASYAEWLWSEREGRGTAQEIFSAFAGIPASNPFWALEIGDPGPAALFDAPVYGRGALTLHALRLVVGDADFFRILREWADRNAGGNVTTDQFVALAESVSGRQLDDLFETWLFTPGKPAGLGAGGRGVRARAATTALRAARAAGVARTLRAPRR